MKNDSTKTGTAGGESDEEEQCIVEASEDLKQRLERTFRSSLSIKNGRHPSRYEFEFELNYDYKRSATGK